MSDWRPLPEKHTFFKIEIIFFYKLSTVEPTTGLQLELYRAHTLHAAFAAYINLYRDETQRAAAAATCMNLLMILTILC